MTVTYEPGDLVQLLSGGPAMTVQGELHGYITCNWISADGVPYAWQYLPEQLRRPIFSIPKCSGWVQSSGDDRPFVVVPRGALTGPIDIPQTITLTGGLPGLGGETEGLN